MSKKKINFDLYRLTTVESSTTVEQLLMDNISKLRPIAKESGPVSKYGDFEKKGSLIFGTLAHSQMVNIPPAFDPVQGSAEELNLPANKGLGFASSFVFDTEISVIVFESNLNGVSLNSFCDFLEVNFGIKIESEIVLDPADIEKLNSLTQISKFRYKIARLENGEIFNTANKKRAVGDATKIADETGGNVIETIISVGRYRGDSLAAKNVIKYARELLRFKSSEEVSVLEITGREGDGNQTPIDLIKNKLRVKIYVENKRHSTGFALTEKYHELTKEYNKIRSGLIKAYKKK